MIIGKETKIQQKVQEAVKVSKELQFELHMEKKKYEDLEKKTFELQIQSLELTGKLRATEDGINHLEWII